MFLLIIERAREREKHQCETETSISCFTYVTQLGIKPATFGIRGMMLQPTELPGKGFPFSFKSLELYLKPKYMVNDKHISY